MKHSWTAPIIIATILIAFRFITANHSELGNFSPIAAMLFCGAAFWKANKWLLTTAIFSWIVTSPLVSLIQGYPPFHFASLITIFGFAAVITCGFLFQGKKYPTLILGTILAASAFYFTTNTMVFFVDAQYTKTLEGYIQCMWTGSPISQIPTWIFYRNSLIGNSIAIVLFLAIMNIPAISKATQYSLMKHRP